jgi:hypothetical protein
MKKPEELLAEFRANREKMTPSERVRAYHAFNDAVSQQLAQQPVWKPKRRP